MPETRTIPVIALTAFAMTEDRTKCFDVGCDAFESKPVHFARLLATIEQLLQRNKPVAVQHQVLEKTYTH